MMKKLTKKEKKMLYEIAAKYIYTVETRGDLEYRYSDEEDFIETSVGGLEAALQEAYECGKRDGAEEKTAPYKKRFSPPSEKTVSMWNEVVKMYGQHTYTLGENGYGEAVLCKGYGEVIAKGNREIQRTLKALLNGETV